MGVVICIIYVRTNMFVYFIVVPFVVCGSIASSMLYVFRNFHSFNSIYIVPPYMHHIYIPRYDTRYSVSSGLCMAVRRVINPCMMMYDVVTYVLVMSSYIIMCHLEYIIYIFYYIIATYSYYYCLVFLALVFVFCVLN